MRGNQLKVTTARWQQGSQICFGIFLVKNHKIAKISTTIKATEKIITHLESLEF
jgi:hypothetical protein